MLDPNGAGKSTTVGMLTTTIAPTSGRAQLAGFDVATHPIDARRVSGVVFQESVLDRPLTGRRNLDAHARLWGLDSAHANARTADVVEAFGLGELIDRPVHTYSGGQRRRLEIARALISDPQVLFLDEPTVGLDPRIRFELLDHTAGLCARTGMTILLTTHYLDEAEQLCDRVAIMHEGRIAALDSPASLLAELGREILDLRVNGDVAAAVSALRAEGIAGDDAFAVGSTVHVPLHARPGHQAVAAVSVLGYPSAPSPAASRPSTMSTFSSPAHRSPRDPRLPHTKESSNDNRDRNPRHRDLRQGRAGLGVLVDRLGGGGRDLLAAPVSRPLIVAGNLIVAVALSLLQVVVLLGAVALRGADFHLELTGVMWFAAAVLSFSIGMYGVAEILANRIGTQEEYIGALPPVAIVPFFFAGSFFPISALPAGLTAMGKALPITHVLALMRYGLVDRTGKGLHEIWGMSDPTTMAALSLAAVVVAFAVALTAISVRVFKRAAVR